MESYPAALVEHSLPLVLVSGLGTEDAGVAAVEGAEHGGGLHMESPECSTAQAHQTLHQLKALDGAGDAWTAASSCFPPPATRLLRYRVQAVGRSYTLPARKAAPVPQAPAVDGLPAAKNTELHSPLSPLSPGSPVFPDGILPPGWYTKHHHRVPALFLAFFAFAAGEPARDELLKNDITAVRAALARSGFKTRCAAVLVADRSTAHAPELEDRLASIRRATAGDVRDPKAALFFMPPMSSPAEIAAFVHSTMAALQPSCLEYYGDLAKHARRKKARGAPPAAANAPVGAAGPSTSKSGWNVRYEVKQGVFAEFRQEMDLAARHYSAAIEELFSSEGGVFETTASWSPRWDEARLLCDTTAVRAIRCQLWSGNHTGAVQAWQKYKQRTKDLIDRRGKGTSSYGWDAWVARWANIMSQLVERAGIAELQKAEQNEAGEWSEIQVYAQPEKAVAATERLPPWNLLHHPGYFLRLLAKGIRSRWQKAAAIPEQDRVSPGQSPASAVARRWNAYDVYLVPEPHREWPLSGEPAFDHLAEMGAAYIRAADEFQARRQMRMAEQLKLDLAEDWVGAGRYADAFHLLADLWAESSWREDEWWVPFGRLLRLLSDCATRDKTSQSAALMPALTWEMLAVAPQDLPDKSVQLTQCLGAWDVDTPISLHLHDAKRLCPITASFAFKSRESHVGAAQECQLTLAYRTSKALGPLPIAKVELTIGSKTFRIRHDEGEKGEHDTAAFAYLPMVGEDEDGSPETTANLSLAPLIDKTWEFSIMLREARIWQIVDMAVFLQTPKFNLSHRLSAQSVQPSTHWLVEKDGKLERLLLSHMDVKAINVLPKPPKVKLQLKGLRKHFYTDERVRVQIQLVNEEAEALQGSLVPKVLGQSSEALTFKWVDREQREEVRSTSEVASEAVETAELTILAPSAASTFTLTVDLRYTLVSDTSTCLTRSVTADLNFVEPFNTHFTFQPRLHPDPWPSFFDSSGVGNESSPDGVLQLWKLELQLESLAEQFITLHKLELLVHEIEGDAACRVLTRTMSEETGIKAGAKLMSSFELTTQKYSLDDRRPSYLDLSMVIEWSHETNSSRATTEVAVPRLTIPTSEPRVLCTVMLDPPSTETLSVQYHLENPSTHFLTFALTMQSSEDFAFRGPKCRTLSLAPLSRYHVDYQVVPHEEDLLGPSADGSGGTWIVSKLQVVDSYYHKTLRVHPASSRVKLDDNRDIRLWFGKAEPH